MSQFVETRCSIESDGLRLEGAIHEGSADVVAVVLHPHPLYGGDLDNHVVITLCRVLAEVGATTLRFNFRGAGASDGDFDGGEGEGRDALAALTYLRQQRPGARSVLAGYSFGAGVAAGIAGEARPDALVLVSLPPGMSSVRALPAGIPVLVITGDRDEIAPPAKLASLLSADARLVTAPGVDHFWFPGLDFLSAEVRSFIGQQIPAVR